MATSRYYANMKTRPHNWSLTRLRDGTVKVVATWLSTWRINSGITDVKEDDEYYYFYGISGSCYQCKKDGYGANNYGIHILQMSGLEAMPEDDAMQWAKEQLNKQG